MSTDIIASTVLKIVLTVEIYSAEWIHVENNATGAVWKFNFGSSGELRARWRVGICAWRAGRFLGEGFDGLI